VRRHRRPYVGAFACQRLAAAACAIDNGQLRVATLARAHDEAPVLEWRDAEQSVVALRRDALRRLTIERQSPQRIDRVEPDCHKSTAVTAHGDIPVLEVLWCDAARLTA